MSQIALQVEHADLGAAVTFLEDELIRMVVRPVMTNVIEQESQTGSLSVLYVGKERYEFDLSFEIFLRSTLEKLSMIRALQEPFRIRPFMIDSPLSSFTVLWGDQPFMELYQVGRASAQWDYDVTWKEVVTGTCPEIIYS